MAERLHKPKNDPAPSKIRKLPRPIQEMIRWMNQYEGRVLLALILLAGGVWLFIFLADQVVGRDPRTLDIQILLAMREPGDNANPLGPPWLEEMGRDFTALGGAGLQTMILILVCGYLILIRKYNAMLLVISAIVGAWVLNSLLKELFERPRPDLVPHGMMVYQASFPSGHAMSAAAFYLTLGVLLVRLHTRRHIQSYFMGAAILITLIVGVSRIYLGVHWPSDVLAGWAIGGVWAILCWMLTRWLQRRGQVEQAGEEGEDNNRRREPEPERLNRRDF